MSGVGVRKSRQGILTAPSCKNTRMPSPTLTKAELKSAVDALAAGELVAFPTETVYGLGADATNAKASLKIFAAKGRPADHPLIVHVAKGASLEKWVSDVPEIAEKLIAAFWPGPLTLILKKSRAIPSAVTGGQSSVGLRCPSHPVAQKLLQEFAKAGSGLIAAPSANRFGHVSPTTAQHVRDEFGDAIPVLDGGPSQVGIESTILDLTRMKTLKRAVILRPGAITAQMIRDVTGEMPLTMDEVPAAKSRTPRASGTLAAHYAPMTPLKLVDAAQLKLEADRLLAAGERVAVLSFSAPQTAASPVGVGIRNARSLVWITVERDAAPYAQMLYANLRTLDAAQTAMILVEAPPTTPEWIAVNDRLGRAAVGSGGKGEISSP